MNILHSHAVNNFSYYSIILFAEAKVKRLRHAFAGKSRHVAHRFCDLYVPLALFCCAATFSDGYFPSCGLLPAANPAYRLSGDRL